MNKRSNLFDNDKASNKKVNAVVNDRNKLVEKDTVANNESTSSTKQKDNAVVNGRKKLVGDETVNNNKRKTPTKKREKIKRRKITSNKDLPKYQPPYAMGSTSSPKKSISTSTDSKKSITKGGKQSKERKQKHQRNEVSPRKILKDTNLNYTG